MKQFKFVVIVPRKLSHHIEFTKIGLSHNSALCLCLLFSIDNFYCEKGGELTSCKTSKLLTDLVMAAEIYIPFYLFLLYFVNSYFDHEGECPSNGAQPISDAAAVEVVFSQA